MIIADEPSMRRLGVEIAGGLRAGDMVTLSGTLGAGKTVLAKAIIESIGFKGDVSSPTFAIIHPYDEAGMRIPVVHADLYRLDDPADLDELGLFDDDRALILVEWPEKGGALLSDPDIAITISPTADGKRHVVIKDKRKQS
jgi:tRNA threonylcarbamoyladenosine biosynthesis protein TsaE